MVFLNRRAPEGLGYHLTLTGRTPGKLTVPSWIKRKNTYPFDGVSISFSIRSTLNSSQVLFEWNSKKEIITYE
jgi:hypothetical protein